MKNHLDETAIEGCLAIQNLARHYLATFPDRPEEYFDALARQLLAWLTSQRLTLIFLNAEGRTIIQHFEYGPAARHLAGLPYTGTIFEQAVVGAMAVFGEDLNSNEAQTYQLAVPLGGQPTLGVLGLSRAGRPFSTAEVKLAEFAAASLSLALENARLTNEIAQAQVVKEAESFKLETLTSVSHELRTPLGLVHGFLSTLDTRYDQVTEAQRREFIRIALEETETLGVLVENLLEMSRLEQTRSEWSPVFRPVAPSEIIDAAILPFLASERPLGLEIEADLPTIQADALQVMQALRNVLDNALRYTPLTAPVTLTARREAHSLLLSVIDEGPGLPPDKLERIFEKFYQVKAGDSRRIKGLGLGLAITRRIVELHGGQVWVTSEPGQGSTFYIRLPLSQGG